MGLRLVISAQEQKPITLIAASNADFVELPANSATNIDFGLGCTFSLSASECRRTGVVGDYVATARYKAPRLRFQGIFGH